MLLIAGAKFYGRVDWVPGLFYVKTRFLHGWYFPLLPTGSYLILEGTEDGEAFSGRRIRFNLKSAIFGWFRALMVLGGVFAALVGTAHAIEIWEGKAKGIVLSAVAMGVSAGCFLILYTSFKFGKASPMRALELASQVGITPETLARYFVDFSNLPETQPSTCAESADL